MNTSEKTDKVLPALLDALKTISNPSKNAKNPHFKNNYANLESVIGASREALHEHDLFLMQSASDGVCTTRVFHVSGQWVETYMPIVAAKPGPQDICGAYTYARRYGMQGTLNMVAEDDDGETASGRGQYAQKRQEPRKMESAAVKKEMGLKALRVAYKRHKSAGGNPDQHLELEPKDMKPAEMKAATTKLNNLAYDLEQQAGDLAGETLGLPIKGGAVND